MAATCFEDLDRLELRLYSEAEKMARSYLSFTRELRRLLKKRSMEFFEKNVQPVDSNGSPTGPSYRYSIPVLPTEARNPKYFIVDLVSEDGAKPVPLLFEFAGMYFQGFFADDFWWLFEDAHIIQDLDIATLKAYMRILSFKGSYRFIGQTYTTFNIGIEGQRDTYFILSKFKSNTEQDDLLKRALCRIVVTICEAIRFPELLEFLFKTFEEGQMYISLDDEDRNFSDHFTEWGTYCRIIRAGGTDLLPGGFVSYQSLLQFVAFLIPE